jgi:hypothetical protein
MKILLAIIAITLAACQPMATKHVSPYAGEEANKITSLTDIDIQSLKEGTGVAFGGMAKLAELNSYPGPRHIIDLKEELNLDQEQLENITNSYKSMNQQSIQIGEQILTLEEELDLRFKDKTITRENLQNLVSQSASLYGRLRNIHLQAHLESADILTEQQIMKYDELRGYNGDPCSNIPEGHPPEMWKLHHGCE